VISGNFGTKNPGGPSSHQQEKYRNQHDSLTEKNIQSEVQSVKTDKSSKTGTMPDIGMMSKDQLTELRALINEKIST
jgi:hypothetical protein